MPGIIEKVSGDDSKHEGDVTCIVYQNNYVFSGGADGKIKVWDNDLNLIKTINTHEAYVYALAINSNGKLYSSSCDGTIKFMEIPVKSNVSKVLLKCQDEIESLFCVDNVLCSGDDKGVVTIWNNDKIAFKFNLVEEVKSLLIEKSNIYTARDLDAVVTEVMTGKSGKYSTKATIPGRAPLTLIGPTVDERKSYFVFCTRDGKGIISTDNLPGKKYAIVWTKENCHEMIINALCGTEKYLYSAGWDGKVKQWAGIDSSPELRGEVNVGSCVNSICVGEEDVVYSASSDGFVRKIKF